MTESFRDPQPMSATDRKAEIVTLLATAYVRRLARRNGLDVGRESEPDALAVDGDERHGAAAPSARTEVA